MFLEGENCDEVYIRNYTRIRKFLKEIADEFGHDQNPDDQVIKFITSGYVAFEAFEDSSYIMLNLDNTEPNLRLMYFSKEKYDPVKIVDLLEEYFGGIFFKVKWELL